MFVTKAIVLLVCFSIGTFIWENFHGKNWSRACEISYFQAVILAIYVFMIS
jgi:hypothetical protein